MDHCMATKKRKWLDFNMAKSQCYNVGQRKPATKELVLYDSIIVLFNTGE